ncbi:uncharacterized protein LOC124420223 [Lucilia cuprina]|uniref:uncharacterized protein LOC124420223 n=1 Tax=Lucilia cuprina TaxID=7375 RepID=UPI001F06DE19|nr:uncharacterized protein LOC124420223 [Lucilia cuprina]
MIMQQIWKDQIEWDDPLKAETLRSWLSTSRLCDASDKAYAATLYLRTTSETGHISTHLLLAKTKVAPVKFVTLPRKELCGAELLAKLISTFLSQVNFDKCNLHLWTDSTIVLSRLQKHPSHWTTFVANRITSIVEKVGNDKWRHVSSKDNPADLGSRGLTAKDLICNDL